MRFPLSEARTAFLAVLERDDRYLFEHVRALFSQPTVAVARDVEGAARTRLRAILASPLGRAVKIYDDVQFETFDA